MPLIMTGGNSGSRGKSFLSGKAERPSDKPASSEIPKAVADSCNPKFNDDVTWTHPSADANPRIQQREDK